MKKNIAMRVAAILFILTMISTCAFSTTFAKYVTSGEATDTARVAKWGVEVSGSSNALFNKAYKDPSNTSVTVEATENVLAPGTSGTFVDFVIAGTPEVDCEVTFDATLTLSGWAVTGVDFYCPVIITVGTTVLNGLDYDSAASFKTDVEEAIESNRFYYESQTSPSANGLDIVWEWKIADSTGSKAKQTNDNDTALGDAAADGNASTIKLDVTCTVTQID